MHDAFRRAIWRRQAHRWRLDQARFAPTWDSSEGAFQVGGRLNSKGVRVVYCALDPATAILEVAVHKGFKAALDVPNANWLRLRIPGAGQQAFGDALLAKHKFVVIPSVVSNHSWNLIFDPTRAKEAYQQHLQEAFALDTRLHPSTSPP